MNRNSKGEKLKPSYHPNVKRKFDEVFLQASKKPRISNPNEHSTHDELTTNNLNSLYYQPVTNVQKSPNGKTSTLLNTQLPSPSKKFSANDRLQSIRKNLELTKINREHNSNNNKFSSYLNVTKTCSNSKRFHGYETAKPKSLNDRINSIRNSFDSAFQAPKRSEYIINTQNSTVNLSSETLTNVPAPANIVVDNVNESDDSMDWSFIEEKQVLSKINEIRNKEIITKITPSTYFQECVAKELLDIPHNNTILKDIYVIIDTNVFISQLNLLSKLLEIKVNGVASPILLIPWIVIQELDFLKDHRTESKLRKNSQTAINFINEKLTKKHPHVKGQSVRDAAQQNFSSKNADDSILHCCLQIIEKQNRAMLLSNDINLRNKAIIHGIDAYSHSDILKALDPYNSLNSHTTKIKDIEFCFRNLFSFIIFMHLKESYGTALNNMDVDLKNPPWILEKCLQLFQRFWQPIFSMFLQKEFLHKLGLFIEFLKKRGNIETLNSMDSKIFVEYGLAICIYLKNALHLYEVSISDCINNVETIVKTMPLPDTFVRI